jgi:hypothetical protein
MVERMRKQKGKEERKTLKKSNIETQKGDAYIFPSRR